MSNQLQISGAAKIRSIQGPVVANSGVITALDGDASQYVRGDGTLADFPTSTGGGSSVSYYLNTSVSQGTIGGVAYKQLSKVPISGAGTDITISANGYIASYLTDANDPALLEVPAGNFNCEFYFSVNSNAHNPYFYAEVYKYDGTTFTLLGSSQSVPEYLTNGTTLSPYYFAIPVATSVLTITDRIAVRIFVNVDGRTVTLHTENNHLCQVVTTFSKGLTTLNSLTRQVQFFQTGTSGTDFAISSSVATHTFNLPVASAANTGKLSSTDWSTFNGKVPYTGATANVDLGLFGLTSNAVKAIGDNSTYGGVISIKQNNVIGGLIGTGYTELFGKTNRLGISFGAGSIAYLSNSVLTAERTYTLPDATGTLALTSDLSSYVPYTGATTNVNLGSNNIFSNFVYAEGAGGTSNGGILIKQYSGAIAANSGYTSLFATINQLGINFSGVYNAFLQSGTFTASRTYTLPDASGTLALLESNQTFSGLNTFSSVANMTATLQVQQGLFLNQAIQANTGSPYTAISGRANGLFICPNSGTGYDLIFPSTSSYSYTFPAASGTLALTSQLTSGTVTSVAALTLGTTGTDLSSSVANSTTTPVITLNIPTASAANRGALSSADWTTFNNKASTADLANYLLLTGGTLTGQLYINPTNTATVGLDVASNTIRFRSDNLEGFKRQLEITMGSGTLVQMVAKGFGANYITDMAFSTSTASGINATPAIYITGTNNRVGIKTGTPSYDLSVNGNASVEGTNSGILFDTGTAYTPRIRPTIALSDMQIESSGNGGNVILSAVGTSASIIAFETAGTRKMTITNAGNVGIGTVSPTRLLDVNGVIRTQNSGSAGAPSIELGTSAQGNGLFFPTTNTIAISTNDTERMRIRTDGIISLGAGYAAANSFNYFPIYSAGQPGFNLLSSTSTDLLAFNGNTKALFLGNLTGGATTLSTDASGNVIRTPSDINLKTNIQDLEYGLQTIMQLRPIIHNWKESIDTEEKSINMGEGKSIGFIAQEVELLVPEIVCGEEYKSIDYPKMVAILTKAIQELSKQNEELSNRLIKLENK
jgi:hypothetical protein